MTTAAIAHPDSRQLEAYALGTLEFDEVSSLEEHLIGCQSCCAMLNDVSEDSFLALIRKAAVDEMWEPSDDGTMLLSHGNAESSSHDDFGLADVASQPIVLDDTDSVPDTLLDHGRYRILGRCGSGGMGVVYRAEHRLMGREVALKVIRPHLLRRTDAIDRFRREVRAAALLSHPNIVSAYDAEEADGFHFLVMEYVAGSDLASVVAERGPLAVSDACEYIRQAAEGLMHAHERGMVHRDVKPQNLMLTEGGKIKILDFGLSKFASESESAQRSISLSDATDFGGASLTSISTTLGTPDYVAPEQTAVTRYADVRADIYGLGCTLYFLLTGRPPFPGSCLIEKLRGHADGVPRAVSDFRDDVPPGLIDILARMTAKRPEDRYQSPAEVATALRPFTVDARTEGVLPSDTPPSPPNSDACGDDGHGDARRHVESPANGILAVAVLNLVLGVWSLSTMPHTYPVEDLWSIWAAVGGISMIPATLVIMQGALRMRRLESFEWSCAAAIYALIPWTPMWLLGFPMGVWALWALSKPSVRRGFGQQPFSPPTRRRGILLAGLLLLLPFSAGAGGIVFIETDKGEIAIEAHDPDARIRVLKGGQVVEVLDPVTNESVIVDTGVYTIQLGSSGFSTSIPEGQKFVVHRGEREVVTVRRVDGMSTSSAAGSKKRGEADPAESVQVESIELQERLAWQWKIRTPKEQTYHIAVQTFDVLDKGFPDTKDFNEVSLSGGEHELTARFQKNDQGSWVLTLDGNSWKKTIALPDRAVGWLQAEPPRGFYSRGVSDHMVKQDRVVQLLRIRAEEEPIRNADGSVTETPSQGPAQGVLIWLRADDDRSSNAADKSAQQILDQMAETYRNCKSYRDAGVVKTVFIKDGGKRTTEKTFQTAFVRPDQFRYEYRDWMGGKEKRYVIWRNGDDVKTWWDIKPQVERPESLHRALHAAVGVSGNSSLTIPALLLRNEVDGGLLTALAEVKRLENDMIENADCFRLEGTYAERVAVTVWVDAKTFLVRRIDERMPVKDFRTETTTTYEPAINVQIPAEELEFKPANDAARVDTVEVPLIVKFDGDMPPLEKDGASRDGDAWKIEAAGDRTVRLYEATLPGSDGKGITNRQLSYRAKIKTQDVKGRVYLEMWLRAANGQKSFSRGFEDAVNGTTDWVEVQTPFRIKDGERADRADLNVVIEGGGTAWIKDIVLEADPHPDTRRRSR